MNNIYKIAGAVLCLAVAFVVGTSVTKETRVVTVNEAQQALGAIAGDSIDGQDFTVGGMRVSHRHSGFSTATTTPCSFKSPEATSTLSYFGASFTTGTTSAVVVTFSKGTAQQASTTALSGSLALAANAKGAFIASTTPEATFIIAPNNWIQVNMVGGSGTVSPVGSCSARFNVI